jgi:D-arabinose 1-dehydrogenase-like Zn-dependent alcohol dehydrogenase
VFEGDCILGHEGAGVVLKVGEGVTDFQPGTFVASNKFDGPAVDKTGRMKN